MLCDSDHDLLLMNTPPVKGKLKHPAVRVLEEQALRQSNTPGKEVDKIMGNGATLEEVGAGDDALDVSLVCGVMSSIVQLVINPFSAEIDFGRQNLTSVDVRF